MSLTLFVMNNLDWWIATWLYMWMNYFMNNLDWWNIKWGYVYMLMIYYMNAYVELTWWLYDVAIKWWTITWMFICWWTMIWNAYVELTWWISMRLWYWSCTLLLTLSLMSYVVVDVVNVVDVVKSFMHFHQFLFLRLFRKHSSIQGGDIPYLMKCQL